MRELRAIWFLLGKHIYFDRLEILKHFTKQKSVRKPCIFMSIKIWVVRAALASLKLPFVVVGAFFSIPHILPNMSTENNCDIFVDVAKRFVFIHDFRHVAGCENEKSSDKR